MKRTIAGVPFIVHSPSYYEVAARDDGSDIARAIIVYDSHWWTLHVRMKRGYDVTRDFRSFAEAVDLIGGRV